MAPRSFILLFATTLNDLSSHLCVATYTAGLGGSTDSSSGSDATTINGLIAGLTIALFLFLVATTIAVYYFCKSRSGSTSPTTSLVQAIEMKV